MANLFESIGLVFSQPDPKSAWRVIDQSYQAKGGWLTKNQLADSTTTALFPTQAMTYDATVFTAKQTGKAVNSASSVIQNTAKAFTMPILALTGLGIVTLLLLNKLK